MIPPLPSQVPSYVALNTETRLCETPAAAAELTEKSLAPFLSTVNKVAVFYKKIDSTFRGYSFLLEQSQILPFRLCWR